MHEPGKQFLLTRKFAHFCEVVYVVQPVGDVGGDLHTRDPRWERGEPRVSLVLEAIPEIIPADEIISEVDVIPRD